MESNRDESKRCRELGDLAAANGEHRRAMKYLSKAQRLFPTPQVAEQLAKLESLLQQEGQEEKTANGTNGEESGGRSRPHKRHGSVGGPFAEPSSSASASGSATEEQIEVVRRIRRCKDFYEILEVSKSCTEEDVKKAYRKLSLKVHPDKNTAPGAEEAFKAVSRAFQCLSDKRLRANYDATGHEDPQQALREQRSTRHTYANPSMRPFYDEDFDPNDIFNAFFGMQGVQGNARVFRAHFGQSRGPAASSQAGQRVMGPSLLGLLQLLPLLAIFLYALIPAAEPQYKLQRVDPYLLERRTSSMGVSYFVRSDEFDRQYPTASRQRRKLEHGIEAEYRDLLETRCYYERVQQAQLYRWGDAKKAREMGMPNCDELRGLQRAW